MYLVNLLIRVLAKKNISIFFIFLFFKKFLVTRFYSLKKKIEILEIYMHLSILKLSINCLKQFLSTTIIKMNAQQLECPICLDALDLTSNRNIVTTECGHSFHCNCIMQSCAHNGFGCPYCRSVMAETPEEEDEEFEEEEEEEEDNDYALRGFRFFFNNVEGEEHDHEDVLEEQEDDEEGVNPHPDVAFVTQTLAAQGVTMQQLVSVLLLEHEEYENEEEEFDRIADNVWERMRVIISNYQPLNQEQEPQVTQQPLEQAPQVTTQQPLEQEAEPKHVVIRRREFMSHV